MLKSILVPDISVISLSVWMSPCQQAPRSMELEMEIDKAVRACFPSYFNMAAYLSGVLWPARPGT